MASCTVVSLVPFPITEEKPGLIPMRYYIPASDGKKPQTLIIKGAVHHIYIDETRGSLPVKDAAEDVARSLVQDYTSAQLATNENAGPGIFWLPGVIESDDIESKFPNQLLNAALRQKNWFTLVCRIADDDFAKYHQHNVVSDFQRIAATFLGLNPEEHIWMNPKEALKEVPKESCFACGSPVNINIAVCPVCKCILDKEKFERLSFVK